MATKSSKIGASDLRKSASKQRKRNYRVPFQKDRETGEVFFPASIVLFEFVRYVLKDLVQETRDESIYDSEVARFIYPGYPYAHQFKLGQKNVNNVIELTLLTRNLGVPLAWVQNIRSGAWNLKTAIAAYNKRKAGAALSAQATHTGGAGSFDAVVRVANYDPALLGDTYATLVACLRAAVSDPAIDGKKGSFV